MKSIGIAIVAFFCTWFNYGCNLGSDGSISYPTPFPDSIAIKYMPGTVTSGGLDFNAAFSPDGKFFYFGRSEH